MSRDPSVCFFNNTTLTTVIVGSFRKHLMQIFKIKHELEKRRILVLSPTGDTVINSEDDFIVFQSDPITDPKLLQDSVFAKIRYSTFR